MPTLTIPKSYQNSKILREQDLDNIREALLTFFNIIKLDETNLQLAGIITSLTTAQANIVLDKADNIGLDTLLSRATQATAEDFYAKSEIYDSNSNQLSTATTITTSFVDRLTYTFPASGTYLVTYGLTVRTPNRLGQVRLFNNGLNVGIFLRADSYIENTNGVSASSGSFALVVVGVASQDLTLRIAGDTASPMDTDVFMSTVRLT